VLDCFPHCNFKKGNDTKPSEDAMEPKIDLTVVLPCLNESQTLEICIKKSKQAMERSGISGEILVADNGSTDGSREIALKSGARVINVDEKGYGNALRYGIDAANGEYIIMADADDSYDLSSIGSYYTKLREGYDLVIGNRFKGVIDEGAMPFLHRYLGNPVLSWMGKIFFRTPCGDFHCGMRGFTKKSVMKMNLRTAGMEFASEMLVKASLMRLQICEIPTDLKKDGRNRPPHLQTWRDGWRHLRFLLIYSPRWLFFYPGLFMILLGGFIWLILLLGAKSIGGITFDIHSMMYSSAMIIVGYQAVAYAILTKIFAVNEGLLPPDERIENLLSTAPLESGIIIGGILIVLGSVGAVMSVYIWWAAAFGHLDPSRMMRIVIPSVVFIALGVQTIFTSFFISVLQLKRR
jgi:glycosyltransferase involved in cell wall biosynthesis